MIDLAALASLRAVAAHGSVAAAAQALGYTPSAVSQQVKRLERQAGVPLLERVGRGVVLTHLGQRLADDGGRVLRDVEALEAALHGETERVAGRLRVAAFSTAVRGVVAPVVGALHRAHPELVVSLSEREPWETVDLVATGLADLGVVHRWGDVPLAVPEHVVTTTVGRDVADVVLAPGHRLAGRAALTPADVADEDWIATPEGTICRDWLARMHVGTGRAPRIAHESTEFDSHLALARAGLGIALVPRLGRSPLGEGLVAVRMTDPVPTRDVIVVHRASSAVSPAVQAVLAALDRACGEAPLAG